MGSFPVLTKVVLARTRTRTRVFEQGHKRTPGMAPRAYVQNFRSSGYGYDCRTSVELSVRVIPGVNTPGMVLYVPYRTQPCSTLPGTWYIHTRYQVLPVIYTWYPGKQYVRMYIYVHKK